MEKGNQRINGKTRRERFSDLYKELLYISRAMDSIIASDISKAAKKCKVSAVSTADALLVNEMTPSEWVSYIIDKREQQEAEARVRHEEKKRQQQAMENAMEEDYINTLFTPEAEADAAPEQEPEQEDEELPVRPRGVTSSISVSDALAQAEEAIDFVRNNPLNQQRKLLSNIFGADYVRDNPILVVGAAIVEELTALRLEIAQLQTILDK